MVYRDVDPKTGAYVQVTPKATTIVEPKEEEKKYSSSSSGGSASIPLPYQTIPGGDIVLPKEEPTPSPTPSPTPIPDKPKYSGFDPLRQPGLWLESQGITPEVIEESKYAPSPVRNTIEYGKYQADVKRQESFASDLRYIESSYHVPFRPPYLPPMPGGEYYKKDDQFFLIPSELKYVITHAEPVEAGDIIRSLGGSTSLFESSFFKAYSSLTYPEKVEYGYTFVPFRNEPMEEWKYHPGGTEYMESHKEDVIDQYIRSLGGIGNIDVDLYKYASISGAWSGKKFDDPSLKREQAWENLMYTEKGRRELYFGRLPASARWYSSAFHATVTAMSFPITLPQMGVKLFTGSGNFFERLESGKTLFLPDVGKEIEKFQPGGPRGIISTGISTGISLATGNETSDWDRFMKDPISGVFASGGELFGLYLGGQAWNVAKVSTVKGLGFARSGLMRYTGWNIPGYESFMKYSPSNLLRRAWWGAKERLSMSKYIPEEDLVWNTKVLNRVINPRTGKPYKFAESPGAGSQYKLFQLTRDMPIFEGDIIGIHASPHRFGSIIRIGKGSSETPGLSVSAFGEGSPHFLDVSGYSGYSTGGFSLFPRFKLPTAPLFRLKDVYRIPNWLRGKSYDITSKYILKNPKGPYAWIAPKSELGGPEIEAIIRSGTWGKRMDSFFYTTFKGRIVPLPEYNLFGTLPDITSSSISSSFSNAIKDFVSLSSSSGAMTVPIINPGYIASSVSSFFSNYSPSISSYSFKSVPSSFKFSSIGSIPSFSLSSFKSSIGFSFGSSGGSSISSGYSSGSSSFSSFPSSSLSSSFSSLSSSSYPSRPSRSSYPYYPSSSIVSIVSAPPPPSYQIFSPSPPSPFKLKFDFEGKKIQKMVNNSLGLGYRYRKWRMPSLEDFFNDKKFLKGGI